MQDVLSVASGSLVSFILGLVGGGGIAGGFVGTLTGQRLAGRRGALALVIAAFVILIGLCVLWKGLTTLLG